MFGYQEKTALNGAAQALSYERTDESYPVTNIVSKKVEDTNMVQKEPLGKSKTVGQGLKPEIYDAVHGAPSLKSHNDWNARKCITGEPTAKMLEPDADLGKCVKPGCRNVVWYEQDKDRAFGTPTIRMDIPKPAFRSVADHQNYGDEPEAISVILPAQQLDLGAQDSDFTTVRSKNELRSIFEKLGYVYRPAKFNAIFNRSVTYSEQLIGKQLPVDHSTAKGMMRAVQEMHNI